MSSYKNKFTCVYDMIYRCIEECGEDMTTQEYQHAESFFDRLADIYHNKDMTQLVCIEQDFYRFIDKWY